MSKKDIYCVPEKKRKYYFASNGEYDSGMEHCIVDDYTLWANLNALDTITSPATVLVTELKDSKAYMYRVKFNSTIPDIFETAEQKDESGISQYVFFVPSDRFLRFESTNHCVPIPENNWEEYSFRFHALAAFYRLNVVPSLSMPLFEREDLFSNVCADFYKKYHFEPPLNTALSSIFCDVFYALEFFGFLTPSNLVEKESVDAARKLADSFMSQQWGIGAPTKSKLNKTKKKSSSMSKKKKRKGKRKKPDADIDASSSSNDNDMENENDISDIYSLKETGDEPLFDSMRSFAFSEIKFAIERYHNECFPWRQSKLGLSPDVLDYTSYCNLLNAVQKVRRSLMKLRLLPTDSSSTNEALRTGVNRFQEQNGLPIGPCDLFTLRRLWNGSNFGECDTLALCRLCGMQTKGPEVPVFTKTLNDLHVVTPQSQEDYEIQEPRKIEQIESVFNEALKRVRDRSEAQQLMMSEAQTSVQKQISRVEKAEKEAKKILTSSDVIKEKLEAACEKGKQSDLIFDNANEVLDEIIKEHESIKKEFISIRQTIDNTKNGNKILFFVNFVLFAIITYRFVQLFG